MVDLAQGTAVSSLQCFMAILTHSIAPLPERFGEYLKEYSTQAENSAGFLA